MARYWRRWERYTNLEPVSVPWGIFSPAGQVGMPALIRKMIDRKDGYSKRAIRMFLFKALADRRANLTDAA